MSWSTVAETAILSAVFRGVTLTPPATLYFALFTAAPTDAGGGTEVIGAGYARVAVVANTTNFPAPSGAPSGTSNAGAITFPAPTADWGSIVAIGVFSAATAGTLWAWAALGTVLSVNAGDAPPSFPIGAFVATEN